MRREAWRFRPDWALAADAATALACWAAESALASEWESAWAGLRTRQRPEAMPATTATSAPSPSTHKIQYSGRFRSVEIAQENPSRVLLRFRFWPLQMETPLNRRHHFLHSAIRISRGDVLYVQKSELRRIGAQGQ